MLKSSFRRVCVTVDHDVPACAVPPVDGVVDWGGGGCNFLSPEMSKMEAGGQEVISGGCEQRAMPLPSSAVTDDPFLL
jgi:hypothetical protein